MATLHFIADPNAACAEDAAVVIQSEPGMRQIDFLFREKVGKSTVVHIHERGSLFLYTPNKKALLLV